MRAVGGGRSPPVPRLRRAEAALGLLDYDDLLLYWHAHDVRSGLAQHIGAHFDHVLVDEYQDTNPLQAEILQALRPDGAGLVVVGDDAQAIDPLCVVVEISSILGLPALSGQAGEHGANNYR